MSIVAILSWLIGAALGIRFKVMALLPATAAGSILVAAIAGLRGSSLGFAGMSALVFVVTLQLGYLGGLAVRTMANAQHAPSSRHVRPTIVRS
ncbi:hypothetical protein [Bradyrhizobium sp.]|uniref:hypothetical protein n=1 Tax=Bradyrhizobium sp. TaxID=376 RepID=UPI0039E4EA20